MKILLTRKAADLRELKRKVGNFGEMATVEIEERVILTEEEYNDFASDFFLDRDFIKQNIDRMYVDNAGIWHCILVTTANRKGGIMVESEGYEYARYTGIYKG